MPLSLAAAADDLQRLSWTLRRKPLESFLAPQAALPLEGGGGVLVCHDGSLVSLMHLDGARSMMGTEELDRFVEIAALRFNTAFALPGHALHVVFERAPDEAAPLAEAHAAAARRQARRLRLDLDDLLTERARRLGPLIAPETLVLACWTRPSVLPRDRLERDRKGLRKRLRDWLPDAGEAQCPHLALEGLWARHEALLDAVSAVLAETGVEGRRLTEEAALRLMRRMVNGAASTAPGWRPVTVANDAPARLTEPPEAGAYPPPLAPQLLVRDPERTDGGIRMGERLYGALDMSLGPRRARPFAELMAGLAAAGLPCRVSLLIEGGGLHRRFEQLVVNTPGPVELWALTTSPADVALRRRVHALLPPALARAALARAFPAGTARPRIESELARLDAPGTGRAASEEAVLDGLADEVARIGAQDPSDSTLPAPQVPA